MKFIDLYNKAKNTSEFRQKINRFDYWKDICAANPKKYKLKFNKELYCFELWQLLLLGGTKKYAWCYQGDTYGSFIIMENFV